MRGQKLYVSPPLIAAAVLITGNDFENIPLSAKCLNLNFISQSTFTRIQTHVINSKHQRAVGHHERKKLEFVQKGKSDPVW